VGEAALRLVGLAGVMLNVREGCGGGVIERGEALGDGVDVVEEGVEEVEGVEGAEAGRDLDRFPFGRLAGGVVVEAGIAAGGVDGLGERGVGVGEGVGEGEGEGRGEGSRGMRDSIVLVEKDLVWRLEDRSGEPKDWRRGEVLN
jgi:hypothetical protein